MDFFTQKRLLYSLIVVLVVMNLGLVLVLWLGGPERRTQGGRRESDDEGTRVERLLRDELGFDQAQIDRYLGLHHRHQERMQICNRAMQQLKIRMFEGVLRDQPAPALSDSLLQRTQETQVEIERLTFQHLLDLKNLCRPEQRDKLTLLIHDMFRRKTPPGDAAAPRKDFR
jgi:hypothetical protein